MLDRAKKSGINDNEHPDIVIFERALMKKITILALHNTLATTVLGPMDIFSQAGVLWNHIHGLPLTPYFDVEIVSHDGKPVKCLNNVFLQPHRSIGEVKKTDLILVSSITDMDRISRYAFYTTDWLKTLYLKGAQIASVCTGAFVLA